MISVYDVIKAFEHAEKNHDETAVKLSEDHKSILDSKTGERLCSIDTYVEYLRSKHHCNFESIYYEHATLTDIYRCKDCGTVIFGGDDEYHYNPNEKCPTCCHDDSVCHNEYWTKEQIESDPEKKKTIEGLIEAQKEMNAAADRRKARGGLYDWERWQKRFFIKNHGFKITLINDNWDKKLKHTSRYLEIHTWKKSEGIIKHTCQIPLSCYFFYIKYIFPYSKKCKAPELRKYHFWQKKPVDVK